MRVMVAPLNARIGGTQIVALDLGASVRDRGHEVFVYSEDGPLSELIAERDLVHLIADRPAELEHGIQAARAIRNVVVRERIDLVHAYERARAVQSYFGAHVFAGVPVLATIYAVAIDRHLPDEMPIVVGTHKDLEQTRARRRGRVDLLEPKVDTRLDHPSVDGRPFRDSLGIETDECAVVTVSRLSPVLKLEGLLAAMDAVAELARQFPVRMAIVGDGAARPAVEERAESANAAAGRPIVALTGWMSDPRPAYAAADVILGMGSSALRALAFHKPTIILGENGFSEIFEPATAPVLIEAGMYGFGNGRTRLTEHLRRLVADPALRRELGRFGGRMADEQFSLATGGKALEAIYEQVIENRAGLRARLAGAARAAGMLSVTRIRRRVGPPPSRPGRRQSER